MAKEKVVIFGATEIAMMCHFYFTCDSPYEVVAFTLDSDFIKEETFCNLPVVPFEDIESLYAPEEYKMFVAIFFGKVNKTRAEKYFQAKAKGYELVSYVSTKAVTWPGLIVGDNCIVSEGSVVNPFVSIGNNVIIAGSSIGHHSIIDDHCFLAAQAVVLGNATIKPYCFVGSNATILQNVVLAGECIIGAGATITKSTREKSVYIDKTSELLPKNSSELSSWLTWPAR